MNSCKYWDCGWCYAPDDVETSASSQSACLDPDYCPYLKSQMTEKTNEPSGWNPVFEFPLDERDTIIIDGVKYKRVEEPQSFYDKLWGLLRTKIDNPVECSETTDRVLDLIRENIPEPYENLKFGVDSWFLGYNEALRRVNGRLFE